MHRRADTDGIVARGYDRVAEEYAKLEGDGEWPRQRWLNDLLGRLPRKSRVLDLGCGSGIPALRTVVDMGHTAVGVEVSEEQLERARRNVPEADFILASALDVEFPPQSFEAAVSFYTIEHMPRETHAALLRSVADWLVAGGWFLITFEVSDEPGTVGNWLGVPMFFSHYDAETNKRLIQEAGFEIVKAQEETQIEGTRPVPYLWLLARKSAP